MTSLLEQLAEFKDDQEFRSSELFNVECISQCKSPDGTPVIRTPHHGVKIGVNGVPAPRRAPLKGMCGRQFVSSSLGRTPVSKTAPLCWEDPLKQIDTRLMAPRRGDARETTTKRNAVIYYHVATKTPRPVLSARPMPLGDDRSFLFLFGQSKVLQSNRPFSGEGFQNLSQNQRAPNLPVSSRPRLSDRAVPRITSSRLPLPSPGPQSILRTTRSSTPRAPCPRVNFGCANDLGPRPTAAEPPAIRQRSAIASISLRTPRCSPSDEKLFLNFVSPAVQLQKPRPVPNNRPVARKRIVYGNDRELPCAPEIPPLPCTPETEPEGGETGSSDEAVSLPHVKVTFVKKS